MATNVKHLDSKKYQKALTLEDRNSLANIIATHREKNGSLTIKLNDIAKKLEKDPTTLSKEVKKRRISYDSIIPGYKFTFTYCNTCANVKDCSLRKTLSKMDLGPCINYKRYFCKYTTKFPYVCNGCSKIGLCSCPKFYYKPLEANDNYREILVDSREGSTLTFSEFKPIDDIISTGLKNGQSIEHIIKSNDLPICSKTAYNYLNKGYFTADKLDTHRMVRFKHKERKKLENSKIMRERKMGHQYEDYISYQENNVEDTLSQWDTIEGKKGGKVVLSIKIVKLQIQFYFLLPNKEAKAVVNKLNEIQSLIGLEAFKELFGFALTDNGTEFSDIDGIIYDPNTGELRTNLFFCHPNRSDEKGSCEKNHELFRYILPKGSSFDNLSQDDFNLITSHVNSLKRKSTDFSTPIEKFYAFYGREILDKLGISLIEPNNVILKTKLIKK